MLREKSGVRVQTCFYDDSNPNGIKMAHIPNTTVQAVFIPRALLLDLKDEEELKKPALYFLFGGGRQVYIGKTSKAFNRLIQHDGPNGKEFWDIAVVIISKSSVEDLNKADVEHLENKAYMAAMTASTFNLNQQIPEFPELGMFREAELNKIFGDIKYLLGALGFKLFGETLNKDNPNFETIVQQPSDNTYSPNEIINTYTSNNVEGSISKAEIQPESNTLEDTLFYLSTNGSKGIGKKVGEEFLVCKGSVLGNLDTTNFPESNRRNHDKLFKELIELGVIEEKEGACVFLKDYLFSAPSGASNFVARTRTSGPSVWRDKDNKKLIEYEAQPE